MSDKATIKEFKRISEETHLLVYKEAANKGMKMNKFLDFLIKDYISKKES